MIGYGMAKAAVHQLVKSLGSEKSGLPANVSALALLPVTLDTPMNRKVLKIIQLSHTITIKLVVNLCCAPPKSQLLHSNSFFIRSGCQKLTLPPGPVSSLWPIWFMVGLRALRGVQRMAALSSWWPRMGKPTWSVNKGPTSRDDKGSTAFFFQAMMFIT